jgi:hypothetical protein
METESHLAPVAISEQPKKGRRFSILGYKEKSATTSVLPSDKMDRRKSVGQHSANNVVQMSDQEVHHVMPLLSELSNSIFMFFEKTPLTPSTESGMTMQQVPIQSVLFTSLKSEIASFLKTAKFHTEGFAPEQVKLWNQIIKLMQSVVDFQGSLPKIDPQALDEIVLATERVLKNAPRYIQQTSELSPRSQIKLTQAQIISFVDRLVLVNKSYESQRAQMKDVELKDTIEKIWSVQKRRLENQCFQMTSHTERKMKEGALESIINTQAKNQYTNQVILAEVDVDPSQTAKRGSS